MYIFTHKYKHYEQELIYSGSITYGESQELIHINWGWSGHHNGYFVAKSNIDTDNRYIDATDSSHSIDTRGTRYHFNVSFKMLTYSL